MFTVKECPIAYVEHTECTILKYDSFKALLDLLPEQATSRLADHWAKTNRKDQPKQNKQAINGIKTALAQDHDTREMLVKWFNQVSHFYKSLPTRFQEDLNRAFNSFEKTFKEKEEEVMSPECTILIAGEGSSGKSTLINVLMGMRSCRLASYRTHPVFVKSEKVKMARSPL
ncbi:hypothetical protein ScPMuIL_008440 [Solemya velum]